MRYRQYLLGAALVTLFALTSAPAYGQAFSTGGSGSSSGTSVGGGFSGGSSSGGGSSSSGSTATTPGGGFTGGGSSSSGGFTGSTAPSGQKTGGGSTTAVPSQSNFILQTYANPLTQGLLDITGKPTSTKAFGQAAYPLYSGSGTTTGSTFGGGFGGAGGGFGGGSSSSTTAFGYNTGGITYPANYITVAGDTLPPVVHASPVLQSTVVDVLSRSTVIHPTVPFKVQVNGSTVTIEGTVASPKEKRIAEGIVRMTPGVRAVISNLQVSETFPNPKSGQPIGQ